MATKNLTRRASAMADFTMSREALVCHLSAIEDRISKSANILGMARDYVEGESAPMVLDAMDIVDEQMVKAQHAIERLKSEAGIKGEAHHA
jgi:hypothetical protein